ncbi:hypothetical protein ACCO45_006306 [Purpureocillium lilacinum]|uniref:Uncharacterized protein n=2 Tax=Purpureocillium lilacinum TaxID=33203 RepID=A0ACC4DV44_PURLI
MFAVHDGTEATKSSDFVHGLESSSLPGIETQIPWKSRHTTRFAVKLPTSSFPVPLLASQLSGSQPLPPATLPEATTPSEILARRQPDPSQARLVGVAAPLVRYLIIHHLPRASTPPQRARDTSTPSCKAAQPRFRPLRRLVVAPRPAPLLVPSPFTSALILALGVPSGWHMG